ncbi:hypothetical protein CN553_23510 [Bacillus cereus]|uniref:VanZ-like domain-containing protein n=1 Tax=Bacillus cereus TaxID=1396 RepID=A0A9X6YKL5_BACCE|nr:hypothetical protein CN553_23510 [Bacillus cereus]
MEIKQLCLRIFVGNRRSMDINDLIANTLGCILGYLIIQRLLHINSIKIWMNRFMVCNQSEQLH